MKTFADFGIEIPPDRSGQVRALCPKCSPNRRKQYVLCLSANTEDGSWYCHHCHWNGKLDHEGAFTGGESWVPKEYRVPVYEKGDLSEKALAWLTEERKIDKAVLVRNQIGCNEVYIRDIGDMKMAIQFPYFKDDQCINIKSLAYYAHEGKRERAMRLEGGAERIPYGLNDITGCKEAIWVEGELDKLAVETAGYLNCMSVPNGAPDPKSKQLTTFFEFIERCKDQLDPIKKHIIAVDNDRPGKFLEDELARRLGPERCRLVEWPEGCKDANDVLRALGPDGLSECIKKAKDYPVRGIFTVQDITPRINALYTQGYNRGSSTGFRRLDPLYRVRPGEFTVVTGSPGCGKSELLDALALNLAEHLGWSFGVFSPENQPLERHFAKLVEKYIGKPFSRFEAAALEGSIVQPDELQRAIFFLGQHFHWILPDDEEDTTLESILNKAKVLVARKGIRGLIIDPWNEINHCKKGNLNENEYIGLCLSRVRRFCRTYGVHIFIVAHPRKLVKIYDKQTNKQVYVDADLYDISGSANWFNKPDYGISVHRIKDKNQVKIIIRKVRFKEVGKLGQCFLDYNPTNGRFEERSQKTREDYEIEPDEGENELDPFGEKEGSNG